MRAPNLRSSLRRRRVGDPMAAYDRLPPELRHWLSQAALPWSARSALRMWRLALDRAGGDPGAARDHLDRIERTRLAPDAARLWGPQHPACQAPADGATFCRTARA